MIERLTKEEERRISVRDALDSHEDWQAQFVRKSKDLKIESQLLHKIATISLSNAAAVAHRLDQMHLTMLRILTLLEANNAPNRREAVDDPDRAPEVEGGGDSV
jgi:hypothetical protein